MNQIKHATVDPLTGLVIISSVETAEIIGITKDHVIISDGAEPQNKDEAADQ